MKFFTSLPYFPTEDIELILNEYRHILEGKALFTKGPKVKEFEKEFAQYCGSKFAIAVNSGTSALEIALKAIGIKDGDEVIAPVQTFVATGSCVISNNAKLVFCEVDKNHVIDFNDLKKRITEKTKAVIIVHFAGFIHPEILEIKAYLKERKIYLIEDAAHAHGAKINNIFAGNFGDIGCFSFYSTKVITTAGEGGMITTNDEKIAEFCSSVRSIGINVNASIEEFTLIGGNRRMNEIQAITGFYQLKRLEEFVTLRNKIAQVYIEDLDKLVQEGTLSFQSITVGIRNAYWRFLINLSENTISRIELKEKLKLRDINIDWPYQPLLHLQPIFKKMYNFSVGSFPNSEKITSNHICLPLHIGITIQDAKYIAKELKMALT